MKINILYELKHEPWGGGNQFLKAIKKEFIKKKIYSNSSNRANIILINSHQISLKFFFLYLINKNLKTIHRIDGPISLTRSNKYNYIDKIIHLFSKIFADGVIFQSKWSKNKNIKKGFDKGVKNIIINNAPDNKIFFKNKKNYKSNKINIISTSWSSNMKKGFEYIRYLDQNLNFKKFKITFVGNSPLKFKNIKIISPVKSTTLSKILNQNEYFFTASKHDPCSNSLLEALSCGLIPIYLDSGGHREIVNSQGIIFKNKKELIEKLNKIKNNKFSKKFNIKFSTINNKTDDYINFIKKIKILKPNILIRIKNILFFLFFSILLKLLNKLNV